MLKIPAQTTVEYWKQLTDENAHNRARIEICKWLLIQFNESKDRNFRPPTSEVVRLHKIFSAIETIAEDIGHMINDLLDLRYRKTEQMIALVRRINPEVADIIYHSL